MCLVVLDKYRFDDFGLYSRYYPRVVRDIEVLRIRRAKKTTDGASEVWSVNVAKSNFS